MIAWNRFELAWATALALALAVLAPSRARAEGAPLPDEGSVKAPSRTYVLNARGRRLDVAARARELCSKGTPEQQRALACGTGYWEGRDVGVLARSGAPLGAFKPGGRDLCAAVAELNDPSKHASAAVELIEACGYHENPYRFVAEACAEVAREAAKPENKAPQDEAKLRARAKDLSARAKRSAAEDAELATANDQLDRAARARALASYPKALSCADEPWKKAVASAPAVTRWDGDPAKIDAICKPLRDARARGEEPKGVGIPLQERCGLEKRAAPVVSPAAVLLMTVTQGFGDFLKSRAKEELIDFAVEQLGRQFCACDTSRKINGSSMFPRTCSVIFPNAAATPVSTASPQICPGAPNPPTMPRCQGDPASGDPDIEAITSGQFQKVFIEELGELPGKIVGLLPIRWEKLYADCTQGEALEDIVARTADALVSIASYKGDDYLAFFVDIEAAVRKDVGDDKFLQCKLTAGKAPTAPCLLALMLTVAATAKSEFSKDTDPPHAMTWLEDASVQFCQHYGAKDAAGARPKDGACIYGADAAVWEQIQKLMDAVSAFHARMGQVSDSVQKARDQGKFPLEIAAAAFPDIADAVEKLDDTIIGALEVIAPKEGMPAADLDKVVRTLDLVGQTLRVVSAGIKQDYRAIAGALRIIVTVDLLRDDVNPAFKKGLLFACDLAEAKTSDDVRKVFEDYAAPRDTYRAKFGATGNARWTLNAYVGFFGTLKSPPFVRAEDRTNYKAPDQTWVSPLSAPVGLDVTIPIADPKNHVGFLIAVVDPLELRTTDTSGTTVPDFGGILAPGVFFRVGILKSPITFILGGRAQPLLKSPELCGKGNCWQGQVSAMAGFAVDVPVAPLNY